MRSVCLWTAVLLLAAGGGCAVESEAAGANQPLQYRATNVEIDLASDLGSVFLRGEELLPLEEERGWILRGNVAVMVRGLGDLEVRAEQVSLREAPLRIEFSDGIRAVFTMKSEEDEKGLDGRF